MTPAELTRIGRALYGPVWQPRLAEAVGVHPSAVWRWVNGQRSISAPVAKLIRTLHANPQPTETDHD